MLAVCLRTQDWVGVIFQIRPTRFIDSVGVHKQHPDEETLKNMNRLPEVRMYQESSGVGLGNPEESP